MLYTFCKCEGSFTKLVNLILSCIINKKSIPVGNAVFLKGPLGIGKTFLTASVLKKIDPTIDVTSPTFTIVENYSLASYSLSNIYHLDLYRLRSFDELLEIGLEEMLTAGAFFIEWPEILEGYNIFDKVIEVTFNDSSKNCNNCCSRIIAKLP